jgi:hypothetical protein
VTIAVVTLASAVPFGVATTERIWGSLAGPVQLSNLLFEEYLTSPIANVKSYTKSTTKWLDDDIMDTARQFAEPSVESTTLNNIGDKWQVGDLRTTTTFKVGLGDSNLTVDITNEGSVRKYWEIDHPSFETRLTPAIIDFTGPQKLQEREDFEFSVNGKGVDFGTFQARPGVYRVQSKQLGLISAIDNAFAVSSDENLEIDFSNYLAIPDAAQSEIGSALGQIKTDCANLNTLRPIDCPTSQDFTNALQLTEDSEFNGGIVYFTDLQEADWEKLGLEVTDSDVSFTQKCSAIKTEVTAFAAQLPKGVEGSLFTSVSTLDCSYSYSLTRTFKDPTGAEYPLSLIGESSFLYYIIGEVPEDSGAFTASRVKIQDNTEYPEN